VPDPFVAIKGAPQPSRNDEPVESPRETPTKRDLMDQARRAYSEGRYRTCSRTLKTAGRSKSVVGLLLLCFSKGGELRNACELANRYSTKYPQAAQFYQSRCY